MVPGPVATAVDERGRRAGAGAMEGTGAEYGFVPRPAGTVDEGTFRCGCRASGVCAEIPPKDVKAPACKVPIVEP